MGTKGQTIEELLLGAAELLLCAAELLLGAAELLEDCDGTHSK